MHNGFVTLKSKKTNEAEKTDKADEEKETNKADEDEGTDKADEDEETDEEEEGDKAEESGKAEKMSKSLGNFVTIRDVLDRYHPLALRFFLMLSHYKSDVDYSEVPLESASELVYYMYQTLYDSETALQNAAGEDSKDSVPRKTADSVRKFHHKFLKSMSDDLHTNEVLTALSDLLKAMNGILQKGEKPELWLVSLAALEKEVRDVLTVLGLMPTSYTEAVEQLREKALKRADMTEEHLLQKIEERDALRKENRTNELDSMRKNLAELGILLMDGPYGTTWRPTIPPAIRAKMI